jgi:hypothetical protein
MIVIGILAILFGIAIILYRKRGAREVAEGLMHRLSPVKGSSRGYERLYVMVGLLMVCFGLATVISGLVSKVR